MEEDYTLVLWDYLRGRVLDMAAVVGGHVMDVAVNRVSAAYV
jgi:hypothetical protein